MLGKIIGVATMAMAAGTNLVRPQDGPTAMRLPARRHRPGQPIRAAYRVPTAHRNQVESVRLRTRRIAVAGKSSHRTLTVAREQTIRLQLAALTVLTRAAASLRLNCIGP